MSDPRYTCPDCERVVFHQCLPPSYYHGRRLVRLRLPRLRWSPQRDRLEEERTEWARAKLGPIADALEDEIGADAWYEDEEPSETAAEPD